MKVLKKEKVGESALWTIWEKILKTNDDEFPLQYLSMNGVKESVMVLPITDKNTIIFNKKFCAPDEKWELVLPGGKIENGLNAIETAKKELIEETGYDCETLESIGPIKILPAYLEAKTYGFIASKLTKESMGNLDKSEHLEIVEIKLNKVLSEIRDGLIRDARTVVIVLYYITFVRN